MKGDKAQTRPERRTPPVTKRRTHLKKEFRTPNGNRSSEPCEPRDCRHKFSGEENSLLKVHHGKNMVRNVFTEKRQHIVWYK